MQVGSAHHHYRLGYSEAGHPDATDLTRAFSPGNSDAMDIPTFGLGRVSGLELERQDVPCLKNTGVNFLASGRSRQDVADPGYRAPVINCHCCSYLNNNY